MRYWTDPVALRHRGKRWFYPLWFFSSSVSLIGCCLSGCAAKRRRRRLCRQAAAVGPGGQDPHVPAGERFERGAHIPADEISTARLCCCLPSAEVLRTLLSVPDGNREKGLKSLRCSHPTSHRRLRFSDAFRLNFALAPVTRFRSASLLPPSFCKQVCCREQVVTPQARDPGLLRTCL